MRQVVGLDPRGGDRRSKFMRRVGHHAALLGQHQAQAREQAIDRVDQRDGLQRNARRIEIGLAAAVHLVHRARKRHQRRKALAQETVHDQQQQRHEHQHRHQREDGAVTRRLFARPQPLRHAESLAAGVAGHEHAPVDAARLERLQSRHQRDGQEDVGTRVRIDAFGPQRAHDVVRLAVLAFDVGRAGRRGEHQLGRQRHADLAQLRVRDLVRVAPGQRERQRGHRGAHQHDGHRQPDEQPSTERPVHRGRSSPSRASRRSTIHPRPRTLRMLSAPSLRRRPWMMTATALLSTSSPHP